MACFSESFHSHISDLKPLLAMSSPLLILLFFHHDLLSYPSHSCLPFSSVPSALKTSYSSGISSSVSSWLIYNSESRLSLPSCWKPRQLLQLLPLVPPYFKICLLPSPWFCRLTPSCTQTWLLDLNPSYLLWGLAQLNMPFFVLVQSPWFTDYSISHPSCFLSFH